MGLLAAIQSEELDGQKKEALTEADQEFVLQFAYRTGDGRLTNKLIDELIRPEADRQNICRKFETLVDAWPDWIQKMENLLVALERYRIQEEKAVGALSQLLSAYGISLTEEELRNMDVEEIKTKVKKESSL